MKLVLGLLAALLLVPSGLGAQEAEYGPVRVVKQPSLPGTTSHGYREHAFLVINRDAAPREVTIEVPRNGFSFGSPAPMSIQRSLVVAAGSSARLTLLQPPYEIAGVEARVSIDGRWQEEGLPWNSGHPESWAMEQLFLDPAAHGSSGMVRWLFAPGVRHEAEAAPAAGVGPSASVVPPAPGGPSGPFLQVMRAGEPLRSWSSDWLAYSGYDAIAVDGEGWETAPASIREALLTAAEAGGFLMVFGVDDPAAWLDQKARRGEIESVAAELELRPYGLGVIGASSRPGPFELSSAAHERVVALSIGSVAPFRWSRQPEEAARTLPLVADLRIPVRGLFLLCLAFAIAAGPLNLWWLQRRDRRIWLLWTVPLASLLTCGLVVGWALLSEGMERRVRLEAITVLDQGTKRGATFAWAGYYSTLTPSDGLRFGLEDRSDSGDRGPLSRRRCPPDDPLGCRSALSFGLGAGPYPVLRLLASGRDAAGATRRGAVGRRPTGYERPRC